MKKVINITVVYLIKDFIKSQFIFTIHLVLFFVRNEKQCDLTFCNQLNFERRDLIGYTCEHTIRYFFFLFFFFEKYKRSVQFGRLSHAAHSLILPHKFLPIAM